MAKVRIEITKGEPIRYISHLDYARTIERALRRAAWPVAYSEGFNPHMKVAYGWALGVGVTSEAEYADIELTQKVPIDTLTAKLSPTLPAGIIVKKGKYIDDKSAALMAVVNLATYTVAVPLSAPEQAAAALAVIDRFNDTDSIIYSKQSPKGTREINVKQYIKQKVEAAVAGEQLVLKLVINITPTGSVKPDEVLGAMVTALALPVRREAALIHRTGQYISDGKVRLTPLEL